MLYSILREIFSGGIIPLRCADSDNPLVMCVIFTVFDRIKQTNTNKLKLLLIGSKLLQASRTQEFAKKRICGYCAVLSYNNTIIKIVHNIIFCITLL